MVIAELCSSVLFLECAEGTGVRRIGFRPDAIEVLCLQEGTCSFGRTG